MVRLWTNSFFKQIKQAQVDLSKLMEQQAALLAEAAKIKTKKEIKEKKKRKKKEKAGKWVIQAKISSDLNIGFNDVRVPLMKFRQKYQSQEKEAAGKSKSKSKIDKEDKTGNTTNSKSTKPKKQTKKWDEFELRAMSGRIGGNVCIL